jgi:hypothetical protein
MRYWLAGVRVRRGAARRRGRGERRTGEGNESLVIIAGVLGWKIPIRLIGYFETGSAQGPVAIGRRSYWIPGSWNLRTVYTDDISCHDLSQESNRARQHHESRR